jgi:hypothetical protein
MPIKRASRHIAELFECLADEERQVLQEGELSGQADSENDLGGSSKTMYYIGLDIHKKTICYCVKDAAGCVHREGSFVVNEKSRRMYRHCTFS